MNLIYYSLFIEWGIDMLKLDSCNVQGNITENVFEFGSLIAESYNKTGKEILFSNCHNGCMNDYTKEKYIVREWQPWCIDNFNMWRISNDIKPTWARMLHNIDCMKYFGKYGQPGAWNDPDFLEVGNGEFKDNTTLYPKQYNKMINMNRAHFSLWCITSAPLIAGNNLINMTDNILNILTNKYAIEINQNYLNNAGDIIDAFNETSNKLINKRKLQRSNDGNNTDIWYKPLPEYIGDAALLFLNRNDTNNTDAYCNISVSFIDLPLNKTYCDYFNIWEETNITNVKQYSAIVPPQSVKFLKLYNCKN